MSSVLECSFGREDILQRPVAIWSVHSSYVCLDIDDLKGLWSMPLDILHQVVTNKSARLHRGRDSDRSSFLELSLNVRAYRWRVYSTLGMISGNVEPA